MVLPFCLLVSCFAAWGLAGNMTDPLVKVFRSVFSMTNLQSSLVQSAYYGGLLLPGDPGGLHQQPPGLQGRCPHRAGAGGNRRAAVHPRGLRHDLLGVLTALFTLAAGLSILETSANPFVMSMGPEHNATRRLNFAQAFNPIGSNLGVLLAALLILPKVNPATAEQRAAMSQETLLATQSEELKAVMGPYVASGSSASCWPS